MSSKECEEQLTRLIYDWETEGLLTKINATDIEAIKHLMLENQIQQDTIKTQKLVIDNLSERIDKSLRLLEAFGGGAMIIQEVVETLKLGDK
jgi:hypothetical protein